MGFSFNSSLDSNNSGLSEIDRLPQWAKDERIYNCDNGWNEFRHNSFIDYIANLFR